MGGRRIPNPHVPSSSLAARSTLVAQILLSTQNAAALTNQQSDSFSLGLLVLASTFGSHTTAERLPCPHVCVLDDVRGYSIHDEF